MIKKILGILVILACFLGLTNVEAKSESNFIDIQTYTNIYKLSEDSDVKLPFVKFFNKKAALDKKLDKSGLIVSANAVEVTEDINNFQTIISSDTVDIKGRMEYATIIAANVMISGTIEKDILIFAESVFITETADILGDIVVMAEKIEMKGNVSGNFIGSSSNFLMSGKVGKDFRVHSEEMIFDETNIKGDIYIETESDINLSEKYQNAVINRIQTNVVTEAERKDQIVQNIISTVTAVVLFTFLNMLVRKIKPELFKDMKNKVKAHSSFMVISGVLLLVSIPIICILACICSVLGLGVVTTPLFIMYIAGIVVIITLAKFIVGSVIYEIVKEKFKTDSIIKELSILIGIFTVLHIICNISYIAWYITMAIVLVSSRIVTKTLLKKQ